MHTESDNTSVEGEIPSKSFFTQLVEEGIFETKKSGCTYVFLVLSHPCSIYGFSHIAHTLDLCQEEEKGKRGTFLDTRQKIASINPLHLLLKLQERRKPNRKTKVMSKKIISKPPARSLRQHILLSGQALLRCVGAGYISLYGQSVRANLF